jgi:glycosyltransferase involved in cell wall biosynthesis
MLLKRLGLLRGIGVIIAPRGEFSPGALALKHAKKMAFIRFANSIGLYSGCLWQVSTDRELKECQDVVREREHFFVRAPDLLDPESVRSCAVSRQPKVPGSARVVFLTRDSPKKNLLGAIEALADVRGEATLTVYGPEEDAAYANACRSAAAKLPSNARVEIKGPISPLHVPEALAREHFFLFPTLGENFGHVVPEALSAGCPVLISDKTPWNDLGERGAGWVLPLDDRDGWKNAVQACVDMDADAYAHSAECARGYIVRYIEASGQLGRNLEMFRQALLLSHR